MIYPKDCLKKYGDPIKEKNMMLWYVPNTLNIPAFPKKIYCNIDLIIPLYNALKAIDAADIESQIKTYDGCFNIRKQRGAKSQSLHSWGVVIDINASWNKLGTPGSMSPELVKCFTDAGFDWGGNFKGRKDPMHFQLAKI